MNITERDIFNYVCCPNELGSRKMKNLNIYRHFLKEQFFICSSAQALINNVTHQNVINENTFIKAKERYEIENDLHHEFDVEYPTANKIKLAADGPEDENEISVETYKDEANDFIIKIITTKDDRKLYLFKNDNSHFETISIKLKPAGKVIEVKGRNKSAIIDRGIEISGVELIS